MTLHHKARTLQAFAAWMMLWSAIGCGSSRPENPVPVTPLTPTPVEPVRTALAGVWTGMFDVTSCVGSADWCRSAGPETFSLRLDENLQGVAEIDLAGRQRVAIDVTQSQSTDGGTILKGESAIPEQPSIDLEIHLGGSAASGLTGSVVYTVSGVGPCCSFTSSVATRTGEVLFLRPVTTLRAGALQGEWRGYMKRVACSGDCDRDDETQEMRLWVTQQGSNLIATFNGHYGGGIQLEGTAADRTFTLAHAFKAAPCLVPNNFQDTSVCEDVINFQGSADSLDRMQGTIQRRQTGLDDEKGPYAWTATFELVGVVRSWSSLGAPSQY
jgi:hypothetical protein